MLRFPRYNSLISTTFFIFVVNIDNSYKENFTGFHLTFEYNIGR